MLRFEVVPDWEQRPPEPAHRDVTGVAVDAEDRVFLLTREEHRVLVHDRDGAFLGCWGEGVFRNPHGLTIGPDGSVFCVDNGDHTVRKFTPDGTLLLTLGTPGVPSDTGFETESAVAVHSVERVRHPGPPFNRCTNLAVAPDGDLYVTDGYGNCRVHRFAPDGTLRSSWGEVGTGPGQFHLPHGLHVAPDGRVFVCDRENDRLQIFTPDGEFLAQWTDVQRPDDVTMDGDGRVYVAELWRPVGSASFVHGVTAEDRPGRVTVFDPEGAVVARWGASTQDRAAPGNFIAPHSLALDSHGDLYVGEVTHTFGVGAGRVDPEHADHQVQKFSRVTA